MNKALHTLHEPPKVSIKDGSVVANSRDVARKFKKRHDHVLRDIDNLIKEGVPGFGETPYIDEQNRQTYRYFDMDRDGFATLCMGFKGSRATRWRLDYVKAFNMMEAELLKPKAPEVDLNDPATLRSALLTYTEKVLALEVQVVGKTAQPAVAAPKAAAWDAYADKEGQIALQDVGRILEYPPNKLIDWLVSRKILFRNPTRGVPRPFERFRRRGWFVVRTMEINGAERIQTLATPRGLHKIAALLGRPLDLLGQVDRQARLPLLAN